MSQSQIDLIPFHDDQLQGIKGQDGKGYAVVRRICENISLKYESQLRNLQTTHAHWACILIMRTHDSSGREQEIAVIPIDRVPMWLTQIKLSKVAPEKREKIKLYQIEAADVLGRFYVGGQQATSASTLESILQAMTLMIGRNDGSIATLHRETADIRQELDAIKAEQLRFATQGRTVIHYVPDGYHRFYDWCQAHDVPKLGKRQAEEIHRARELCSKRGVPVYRCEVGGKQPAYYFTGEMMNEWLSVFRRRNPGYFYKTFPFSG